MLARHRVLEELGYAEGWRLTDQGQLLRAIYHESDLLVAEAIAEGLFDALGPRGTGRGGLGVLLRGQAHPARGRRAAPGAKRRRPVNDRLGPQRRGVLAERVAALGVDRGAAARRRGASIACRTPATPTAAVRHHGRRLGARRAPRGRARRRRRRRSARRPRATSCARRKQVADLCEQLARLHRPRRRSPPRRADARDSLLRSVVVAGHRRPPPRRGSASSLEVHAPLRRRGVHRRRRPRSCAATSRTSTGPSSPWSTCPRSSRGRSSRATQPLGQEPAAPLPRRVRGRPRPLGRRRRSTRRSASSAPTSSTSGSSSSTATTRSPSSAASTWPASRRATS